MGRGRLSSVFISVVVAIASLGISTPVAAAGTVLAVGSATVSNGGTFTVPVTLDTGGASVDTVHFEVTYPTAKLQCMSVSTGDVDFPIAPGGDTCASGTVSGDRGRTSGFTTNATVVNITFKALASGTASLDPTPSFALDGGNVVTATKTSGTATINSCAATVTSVADSGAGSLRAAIAGGGLICFAITGSGVRTINALTTLTVGTQSYIDGTTQAGYAGAPLIEINGAGTPNGSSGIVVNAGGSTIKGLTVNRFHGDGIFLGGSGGSTVVSNYVGLNAAGTGALGNSASGIGMQSSNNTIGGTTPADRNVVSGNSGTGIAISGSAYSGNTIKGNFIGTNPAGTSAIGNYADGILIVDSPNNTVGGTTSVTPGGACTGACNLTSGNLANGIGILSNSQSSPTASGNTVVGNYAGVNVSGLSAMPNGDIGFEAQDSPSNTIGGTTPAQRNIFSGNNGAGVSITGTAAAGNVVSGNYIGTDTSGNGAIGNHKMGVNLGSPGAAGNNSHNNTIGGTTGVTTGGACTGSCNVIVANSWSGIYISGNTGGSQTVAGNFIGIGANGLTAIGNAQDGIGIVGSSSNVIGGATAASRNLITGNGGNGVAVVGSTAGYNRIQNNYIGQASNQADIGNATTGVAIADGVQTAILGNNISANRFLGIDLNLGGVSPNHNGGPTGPNGMQNYPVLSSAIPYNSNEAVAGSFNSVPSTTFRLEFFSSPACSGSGYGQGHDYLGTTNVTTDSNGNATVNASLPIISTGGLAITSTATRLVGSTPAETSEFSHCVYTPRPHPDGALVRPSGSSNIFLVEGGQLRPIGSGEVLASYRMSAAEFKTATNADTNQPGGSNLYFREGTLIKGSGPNVYVIDQTSPTTWVKRLITDVGFFNNLGYTAADVITVPNSALGAADGPVIGSNVQHPDGTLVKDPNGPTVYLIEGSQKRLVGSIPMFNTLRYSFAQTKTATSTDLGLASGANLNFREGAVIKGSGSNVYVVDNNGSAIVKRRLGSVAALTELGYGAADIVNVIDGELPSADGPEI